MATASLKARPSPLWSMDELRKHLGMIPAERILLFPLPGSATAEDVLSLDDHYNVICELVDGVLVRKPMGAEESSYTGYLIRLIGNFAARHDLGTVLSEAGFVELRPGIVRAPDVSFVSWKQLPGGVFPKKKIPRLIPELAVEILSESNTPKEMARKRREYFSSGTSLVWQVDLLSKTVEVFTSPTESTVLRMGQSLDGGNVLRGFRLTLKKLFAPLRERD